MITAAIVYAAALLQMVIFATTTWALAAAVGGRVPARGTLLPRSRRSSRRADRRVIDRRRVTAIDFGGSPALVTRRIGGVRLRIGPWPTAAVGLLGRAVDDPDDTPRSWRRLGLARRLIVILGPWLIVFALAAGCLGPSRAVLSFWHGLFQVLLPLDPTPLVRALLRLGEAAPFTIILGVVLAKAAAMNLLPLPALAGGGVIAEIARTLRGNRAPSATTGPSLLTIGGLVVLLFVSGRFGYALVRALIG